MQRPLEKHLYIVYVFVCVCVCVSEGEKNTGVFLGV